MTVLFAGAPRTADGAVQADLRLSIRIVDETADGRVPQGPAGEDRIANSTLGIGSPGWLWLKRDGQITGRIVSEAHVASGADGQPVVSLTLTPEVRERFAALTRAVVGHRIAFVLDNAVITQALINAPMDASSGLQISGYYTESEASSLAAKLMEARPAQ
jgi:preprotein translocase subunit SecD